MLIVGVFHLLLLGTGTGKPGEVVTVGGSGLPGDSGSHILPFITDIRAATFHNALSLCADPHNPNGWWIGDDSVVRYCDVDSGAADVVAGHKQAGNADGVGKEARFSVVRGLACTSDGKRLYMSDCDNNKIRAIELDGSRRVSTAAGHGRKGKEDGKCSEAGIYGPSRIVFDRSVTADPDSVLWMAVQNLRRFDIKTGMISTWLPDVELSMTASIDSTLNGTLIIVNGDQLCSFDPRTGRYDVLAGHSIEDDFADGSGLDARFHAPVAIAVVDHERCVFVADCHNNRIRRVTLPHTFFK